MARRPSGPHARAPVRRRAVRLPPGRSWAPARRTQGSWRPAPWGQRPWAQRPWAQRPWAQRPWAQRPWAQRPWAQRPWAQRPWAQRPWAQRPWAQRPWAQRPWAQRPWAQRPWAQRPWAQRPWAQRPWAQRPWAQRPWAQRPWAQRPWAQRPWAQVRWGQSPLVRSPLVPLVQSPWAWDSARRHSPGGRYLTRSRASDPPPPDPRPENLATASPGATAPRAVCLPSRTARSRAVHPCVARGPAGRARHCPDRPGRWDRPPGCCRPALTARAGRPASHEPAIPAVRRGWPTPTAGSNRRARRAYRVPPAQQRRVLRAARHQRTGPAR